MAAAKRCSYGWHNEQLTAAEYVATISREISANLNFMAEARRRPRPGVLHPTATDEKEDVGLRGEFVNVEDVDDIQDPMQTMWIKTRLFDRTFNTNRFCMWHQWHPMIYLTLCIAEWWSQVGQVPAPNAEKNSYVNMVENDRI